MSNTKYYVCSEDYCGPNQPPNQTRWSGDTESIELYDRAVISTVYNPRGDVDCTYNDTDYQNLGECDTLEEARTLALENGYTERIDDENIYCYEMGIGRLHDKDDNDFEIEEWATLKSLREQFNADEWLNFHDVCNEFNITSSTTNAELSEIAAKLDADATDLDEMRSYDIYYGADLYGTLEWLTGNRDELREEDVCSTGAE